MNKTGKIIKITPVYGETIQWGSDFKKYGLGAEVELIDCDFEEIGEVYNYMSKKLRDAVRRKIQEDLFDPLTANQGNNGQSNS